ncbi:MAG: hypothetical protein KIS81_09545 [Maricaulaceae bacterium]|nr:hypothetical protein [Maricaulaceae bacterium]
MIALGVLAAIAAFVAAFLVTWPLLGGKRRWLAPAAAVFAAGLAFAVYAIGARPDLPGLPYDRASAQRAEADPMALTRGERILRLQDMIRAGGADAQAFNLLGRELARAGRDLEAVSAFEQALHLSPDARIYSDFAQTLINLNEGRVTAEARSAFEEAARLDPSLPEPSFFLGLGAYQDGDRDEAARLWLLTLAGLAADDPFSAVIAGRAADLLSRPQADPALVAELADSPDMTPDQRIALMVEGLERRLSFAPDDLSGWLTLARVKAALGDDAAARAALGEARVRFGAEPGAQALLAAAEGALLDEEADEER